MTHGAEIERLAARVRLAAREGGLIETAQVKLLGLDEVRKAAGARWPRMREHVREGSIKIIAQRVGPNDAIVPCGDGFLVVFADSAASDCERRCREINDALIAFYLGEDALKQVRADVQRESVSAAKLAGVVSGASARFDSQTNELKLGRFWPVWSIRQQRVIAHLCAPKMDAASEDCGARLGYSPDFLQTASHAERDHLDLDLCLLEQACAAAEAPDSTVVGVSVHATTLQKRRSRSTYLAHMADNARPARDRMFAMVCEIEPGTPLMSLTEWSMGLRRTFDRVALDLHHSDRAIDAIASANVWAAGCQLPPDMKSPDAQLRSSLNLIDHWCRTLRRQRIQPLMHGFKSWALLNLAGYSELAFATGGLLWPSQLEPTKADANQTHLRRALR